MLSQMVTAVPAGSAAAPAGSAPAWIIAATFVAAAGMDLSLGVRQLVPQAALQTATESRQARRIEIQILLFGHLDRNGLEAVQPRRTAERPSAGTVTPEHLGFIPGSDLPHFDACMEFRRKLPHELPEIDATFGSEIEDETRAIELLLGTRELHVQPALTNLQQRNPVRLLLPLLLLELGDDVFLCRPANDLGGGVTGGLTPFGHRAVQCHHGAEGGPAVSLHDDAVTGSQRRVDTKIFEKEGLRSADRVKLDRNVRRRLPGHVAPV
jgi:hypothetical protein